MSVPKKAPMTGKQISDGLQEMIARHAVQISEQINGSVQIIVTHVLPDGRTQRIPFGCGDLCARAQATGMWAHTAECAMLSSD